MGWIEGLNDAMDYIEANLEGDLDLAHAARLAACTEGQFRRMFSYIAGIGLGEYVRRRRISRAALDLSRGERVVDVAVRYGYCSPTAFNRAFRDALGISPSEAKRPGAPLSVFPRLSFSLTVTGAEPLVSVNIIFTISTNAFSPIAPTRIRRIRQRGCAAFGA